MEIHRSARKHAIGDEPSLTRSTTRSSSSISNRTPIRLGSSRSAPTAWGNLLEIIWLEFENGPIVIHAMALRRAFYPLLPTGEDD